MDQKLLMLSFAALWCVILFSGCPDSGVNPPAKIELSLAADEVVSTEALIAIHYASADTITINLNRNGETVATNLRMSNDEDFNDTLLQPKQTYIYTAYRIENGKIVDSSAQLRITTLDTTSHNFTWETTTFGGTAGSCMLYDCAVINDTLAYAVGEIILPDSTGQGGLYYNVVKWNGKKWELIKLTSNCRLYYPNCGPDTMTFTPGSAVFAFGPDDVWITAGGIHHFDGTRWSEEAGIEAAGGAKGIWGNAGNLWFVGNKGFIAHRNANGVWKTIESRTNLDMQDIWGVPQGYSSSPELYIGATTLYESIRETKLLHISSKNTVDSLEWSSQWLISSVWASTNKTLYIGSGAFIIYRKKIVQEKYFGTFISKLRGNEQNDLILVGDYGFVIHYNGQTWKSYAELYLSNGGYRAASIKNNIIAAVGYEGDKALLTIGKRN